MSVENNITNPFCEKRRRNLKMTQKIIEKMIPCKEKKLLGIIEDSFGIKRKTAIEYLYHWVDREHFIVENGQVVKNPSHSLS